MPPRGRRSRRLEQSRTLVIVTEGTDTEPAYLKAIRQLWRFSRDGVKVIDNCPGDPIALVEMANEIRSSPEARRVRGIPAGVEYDEAWAVFDVEVDPDRATRARLAIQAASRLGVNVAISNPCFELWMILERRSHTSSLQSRAAAEAILVAEYGGYDKNDPPLPTVGSMVAASLRSAELHARHKGMGTDGNPSTNFERLVCSLRAAANPLTQQGIPEFPCYEETLVRQVCGS